MLLRNALILDLAVGGLKSPCLLSSLILPLTGPRIRIAPEENHRQNSPVSHLAQGGRRCLSRR